MNMKKNGLNKIPADKLAAAVKKHLLPGVIRSLQAQKNMQDFMQEKDGK